MYKCYCLIYTALCKCVYSLHCCFSAGKKGSNHKTNRSESLDRTKLGAVPAAASGNQLNGDGKRPLTDDTRMASNKTRSVFQLFYGILTPARAEIWLETFAPPVPPIQLSCDKYTDHTLSVGR